MSVEIKVPTLGESVSEATVAKWLKAAGDAVRADEPLVELETDKVSLEVNAPATGTLAEVLVDEGADVAVGAILGRIEEGAGEAAEPRTATTKAEVAAAPAPTPPTPPAAPEPEREAKAADGAGTGPAARKIAAEKGVDLAAVAGTGPKGNVTKGDVLAAAAEPARAEPPPPAARLAPAAQP
ncbi:MAG TPA: biotin/lipoyl-containing protein, partial [Geminicoccaceae bacterium]|nr:biotin/lipoyl-containing protein [Geminicoccaceae bacterium]